MLLFGVMAWKHFRFYGPFLRGRPTGKWFPSHWSSSIDLFCIFVVVNEKWSRIYHLRKIITYWIWTEWPLGWEILFMPRSMKLRNCPGLRLLLTCTWMDVLQSESHSTERNRSEGIRGHLVNHRFNWPSHIQYLPKVKMVTACLGIFLFDYFSICLKNLVLQGYCTRIRTTMWFT